MRRVVSLYLTGEFGKFVLAGGTAAVAFVAYGIIAYLQGQVQVVTFCFMMVGSLLGFLWFNAFPALVFMGDTGSLGLGGGMAAMAIMLHAEWPLLLAGGIFLAEAASVVIQVASFQSTGKRVFRRSPLHHHFEELGWPETRIVARFWIIAAALAALTFYWLLKV